VAASLTQWTRRTGKGPIRWQSNDPTDAVATTPGTVEGVTCLRSYSKWQLRGLLRLARLPESLPITCGITMYRVVYWTHHLDRPERVSGLFAVPARVNPKATMMWLHGTSVQRDFAPSTPTREEGVLISAAYSGNGYLTIAPDYVGLGQSQSYHPYLYTPTTVNAARDLLTAAQSVATGMSTPWNGKLFIAGFSQGASAAAVVQRSIEADPPPNVDLLATAAMAPPLNLAEITVPAALINPATTSSLYLAYIVHSFSKIYNHEPNTVLTDHYASLLSELYSGDKDSASVIAALPKDPKTMVRPEFLKGFNESHKSWFRDALVENEAFNWVPKNELRLFVGDNDRDVPAADARAAYESMKANGSNVSLVEVGPYDHDGVVLRSVPRSLVWFNQILEGRP
jgi:pimeloyl-ACP methyl ester carboxylesterase